VSIGEDALALANLRLPTTESGLGEFVCARCYRATVVTELLERRPCPGCGGRIFVRLAADGHVRRVCLSEGVAPRGGETKRC